MKMIWVLLALLPSTVLADGFLNDAATTRRLGGVGNYLFRFNNDDGVVGEAVKQISEGSANFVEIVPFSQSSTEEASAAKAKAREVYFGPGSTHLSSTAEVTLDAVAEELVSNTELKVELAGFADSDDASEAKPISKMTNEEISSARAKAVMEALYKKGVQASQIFWTGKGVSPSESNSVAAHSQARRVEIRFQ